ncbi:MAG: FAD-binding protein [Clostridium sp.]|nr:FAD-binding protein [Clostridium sp.]
MKYKINLKSNIECDVFIIGAGIAGVMAAIQASKNGSKVIISSSVNILSGSSFYPGTWGFGMISPEHNDDIEDFINTIIKVGCDVVDKELVKTFVENINKSKEYLKGLGINLISPDNEDEKEFIPCFDYKKRQWNGLVSNEGKEIFKKLLDNENIIKYPFSEVIDIVKINDEIKGVVLIRDNKNIEFISCKSIVIASGGLGNLFKYSLNTADVIGSMQAIALKKGCNLTNLEFMQMMPGFISPSYKTIFNEKTFKYIQATNSNGEDIFRNIEYIEEKLDLRSTYGPFTSRLSSREIDYAIFNEFLKNEKGVQIKYKKELKNNSPEFIKVYFKWLKENKHLTMDDDINIGVFFHAANGGIYINSKAETGINGLYAAGECTGGMHGADRIGGLSTANALVFGIIAGNNASSYVKNNTHDRIEEIEFEIFEIEESKNLINKIKDIMFNNAMIEKEGSKLRKAILELDNIKENIKLKEKVDYSNVKYSFRLLNYLLLSKAILLAIDMRKESRGSHYRSDYPSIDNNMNKKINIKFDGDIKVYFQGE